MIAHIESEMSVLGAMLRSPSAVNAATDRLRADDFADPVNREIYDAMLTLAYTTRNVDLTTLDAELTRRGKLDAVGGCAYLIELAQFVPSTANVGAYIDIVLEKARLRSVAKIAEAINRRTSADDADADRIIEQIETACWDIRSRARKRDEGWITMEEAALMAFEMAERVPDAVPTGFKELDNSLCGGLWKGELIIVGGRPGKGKSSFMLAAALNAARNGHKVGFFSLEMTPEQNGQRTLASTSLVSISEQRKGPNHLTEQNWAALSAGVERIHDTLDGRFRLYKGTKLTLEKISLIARHAKERGELDLLVIDYLQLMRTTEKIQNSVERIGYISGELKQLALELEIPILTASQIRRQGAEERRKNPRAPTLDELRGSGDLEQDADTVLLVHIPEDPDDATLMRLPDNHAGIVDRAKKAFGLPYTVEIAKQRQGPLGRTWCIFKPMTMRFYDDTAS